MGTNIYFLISVAAIMWAAFTAVFFFIWENRKLVHKKSKWDNILEQARKEADDIIKQAKKESEDIARQAKKEADTILEKSEKIEERIIEREEKLEQKLDELEKRRENLRLDEEALSLERQNLKEKQEELDGKLSELSKLSEQEAKDLFLEQIKQKYETDALWLINKYKKKIEDRKKEI